MPLRSAVLSVRAREYELQQLWLDRNEAGAAIEASRWLVVLLDHDPERRRPIRDRVTLRVGEQPVPDPMPLVAGRDEQLLDDDRPALLAAQGDVTRRLTLLARDEDEVAPEHVEYALVA